MISSAVADAQIRKNGERCRAPKSRSTRLLVASGDSPLMARFADIEAVERHLRLVHAPFGPLSDRQWTQLARNSARVLPDGWFTMHYDPRIGEPLRSHDPADVDMWPLWDRIGVPRLVIRGETSHYDIVAVESARGLMSIGLMHKLPVGNGILTVDTQDQAVARARPDKWDKGGGAVRAALALIRIKRAAGRKRK